MSPDAAEWPWMPELRAATRHNTLLLESEEVRVPSESALDAT